MLFKDTTEVMKSQVTRWVDGYEEICRQIQIDGDKYPHLFQSIGLCNRRLASKTCKNPYYLITKKHTTEVKMGNDLNRHFTKEYLRMTNPPIKKDVTHH